MSISITKLVPGDEIQCWLRLGLALQPVIKGDGTPYYRVPRKPHSAGAGDLTRFIGWVVRNDAESKVITVQVSPMNSIGAAVITSPRLADISYSSFQRVRKFSAFNHEPKSPVPGTLAGKGYRRPGSIHSSVAYRPYRTVEEVTL